MSAAGLDEALSRLFAGQPVDLALVRLHSGEIAAAIRVPPDGNRLRMSIRRLAAEFGLAAVEIPSATTSWICLASVPGDSATLALLQAELLRLDYDQPTQKAPS